jgi:hypothetical protein
MCRKTTTEWHIPERNCARAWVLHPAVEHTPAAVVARGKMRLAGFASALTTVRGQLARLA